MKRRIAIALLGTVLWVLAFGVNPICCAYAAEMPPKAVQAQIFQAQAPQAESIISAEEQKLLSAYHSGSIIRLHILAEDDTPEAVSIKLAVRDAILAAFSADLQEDDPDALFSLLFERVEDMRKIAEETANGLGFVGAVSAEVGVLSLPEKRYGQVVLPEGAYRGLRITLGKGEGQNWWCVLFPSLCLAVADDNPWQTEPILSDTVAASETIQWDSKKIAAHWLLWPGNE